jgi:hypothetical protein
MSRIMIFHNGNHVNSVISIDFSEKSNVGLWR